MRILKYTIIALFTLLPLASNAQAIPTLISYQPTIAAGSLIQAQGSNAVYYIGSDEKRYVFPNSATYFTWYEDFSQVIVVGPETLANYQIGGNITYRPGTRLIKIQSDPRVFAVEPGGELVWIATEETARSLYGENWNTRIDDVPVTFFTDYTDTGRVASATEHPLGTIISPNGTDRYVVGYENDQVVQRLITDNGFTANRYQEKYITTPALPLTYPVGSEVSLFDNALAGLVQTPVERTDTPTAPENPQTPTAALDSPALFVDSNTLASGNGTINSPFTTIAEGIAAMSPGTTLYIRGNSEKNLRVYNETITIPFSNSGNSDHPNRITPYPGEHVTLSPPSVVTINGDWWTIDNMVFDHSNVVTYTPDMFHLGGKHITLDTVELHDGKGNAVAMYAGAQNITITNSSIHDFTYGSSGSAACIEVQLFTRDVTITHNTIYNCAEHAIELFGETNTDIEAASKTTTITHNEIYNEPGFAGKHGIVINSGDGTVVADNAIYQFTSGTAIKITKQSISITIERNTIHDSMNAVLVSTEGSAAPKYIDFFNNVIYNITGSSAFQFDGVTGARVVNNTLEHISGSPFHIVDRGIASGSIFNNLISNAGENIIDSSQKATVSNNGWLDGALPGTLLGDYHITGSNPLFTSAVNHDYTLTADSPAINAGTLIDIATTDFDGITRPQGTLPDLGAFEFHS